MHRESDLVYYEFYSINPPMKLNMKSGKLGMLTVLAIVIYAVMILSSFISEMDDFMLGYEMGSNLGRSITDSTKQESAMKTVYFLDLKAGESISTFPDTIYNLKGAQKIPIRFDKAQILADAFSKDDKSALRLMKLLEIPLSLLMLVIVVLIPVFFIKLNISLKKEAVFDKSNIKCMRWIGILLILYYFVMLICDVMRFFILVYFGNILLINLLTPKPINSPYSFLTKIELIFNSNLKKYLDKGYKKLSDFTHKSIDK